MTSWYDLSDLIHYFQHNRFPTGIQRVQISILKYFSAQVRKDHHVRYFEIDQKTGACLELPDDIIQKFEAYCEQTYIPITAPLDAKPRWLLNFYKLIKLIMPQPLFERVRDAVRANLEVVLYATHYGKRKLSNLKRKAVAPNSESRKLCDFKRGDLFINIGSPWWNPHYQSTVLKLKAEKQIRFVSLIYDIIPNLFPEYFPKDFRLLFEDWLTFVVRESHYVLTISECSKKDLIEFAKRTQTPICDVDVIKLGGDFNQDTSVTPRVHEEPLNKLVGKDFVLLVSSIEPRKNHMLAFRAWKHLYREFGDKLPKLVFAGKMGWLSQDLMSQLHNCEYLNGHIQLVPFANDGDLDWLYRNCMFTIYPSIYEGWGLPVVESLFYKKVCVASSSSSVPEVSGSLIEYYDPYNHIECAERLKPYIFNPVYRQEHEKKIAQMFDVPKWEDCSSGLLRLVQKFSATTQKSPAYSETVALG